MVLFTPDTSSPAKACSPCTRNSKMQTLVAVRGSIAKANLDSLWVFLISLVATRSTSIAHVAKSCITRGPPNMATSTALSLGQLLLTSSCSRTRTSSLPSHRRHMSLGYMASESTVRVLTTPTRGELPVPITRLLTSLHPDVETARHRTREDLHPPHRWLRMES
jgi:hypothetical protein